MASPTGSQCLSRARTIAQDVDDESANLGLSNTRWFEILNECQREVWADVKRAQYTNDLCGSITCTNDYRFPVTTDGLAEVLRLEFAPPTDSGQEVGTPVPITSLDGVLAEIEADNTAATVPTMAAVVAREGSDPDVPFEIVTYPRLTLSAKKFGAWIRKHPTDIENNSTQVDLQPDEADFFIRMAAARGAHLLGHDLEFVQGIESPLPTQFQKFAKKQEKKVYPKERASNEVI